MSGRQLKKARWPMPKHSVKQSLAHVQKLFDLGGRVALITGASGHLGSAMASALAEAGGRGIVASRKIETARRIAASLGGVEQGQHLSVVIDQMDEASIERGFATSIKLAGGIDVLVKTVMNCWPTTGAVSPANNSRDNSPTPPDISCWRGSSPTTPGNIDRKRGV